MASLKEAQTQATNEKSKAKTGPAPQHPRPRLGKTRKDRENHARSKNLQNKETRAMWQNESTGRRTVSSFPWATCNGQRNRYQVTGKGNQTVFLRDGKKQG